MNNSIDSPTDYKPEVSSYSKVSVFRDFSSQGTPKSLCAVMCTGLKREAGEPCTEKAACNVLRHKGRLKLVFRIIYLGLMALSI